MIVFIVGDWRSLALRGLAAVVFGILTLAWPALSLRALVFLFGAYVLVDGIFILANVLRGAPENGASRTLLILEGGASVAAGILTFVWPAITTLALLGVIAAWALLTGMLEISAAIHLRQELENDWILLLLGVLSITLAVVLLISPATGALAITWAIGWYAVLAGAMLITLAWRMREVESKARHQVGRARRATA